MLELLTAAVTESPIFSFSEANVLTLGFSGSQRGASGHLQLRECPGLNMWSLTKGPLLGPSGNSHFLPLDVLMTITYTKSLQTVHSLRCVISCVRLTALC